MRLAKFRKGTQVAFLLFFIILFLRARFPYSDALPSDLFLRFSPLLPLFDFIDNFRIALLFWPALIILILTPFLGRFFCGWVCPLGTTIDAASHVVKSPSNKISRKLDKLRPIKFGILAGAVVLAFFSINVWGYFDPLSIFNRALTIIFYPLFTLFSEGVLLGLARIPILETPAYAVYDSYKAVFMPEAQMHLQQIFWVGLLIGAILGLEKLSRRFWCRYLCPAGALLGVLSQWRLFERIVNDDCSNCMLCEKECKMNAIPEGITETGKVECIECFSCEEVCPTKLNAISYRWRWKPYHTSVDYSRRHFLHTTFGSFAALGLISIGIQNKNHKAFAIRPPGALPEEEFLDKCIRCQECVRICHSNGRCLQPDGIHNSILDLWLPVAVMRTGYCEFSCNLCGEVCPTEAIQPLSLEEKQKTPMGLAYFDKDLCIPYAKNEDCLVCEEHCPLPDKAIKIDEREVRLPDGTTKVIKYPYVVIEKCIGCGICENKCPLPGEPGIFTTAEIVPPASEEVPAGPYSYG